MKKYLKYVDGLIISSIDANNLENACEQFGYREFEIGSNGVAICKNDSGNKIEVCLDESDTAKTG
jgi:hypothetical protein